MFWACRMHSFPATCCCFQLSASAATVFTFLRLPCRHVAMRMVGTLNQGPLTVCKTATQRPCSYYSICNSSALLTDINSALLNVEGIIPAQQAVRGIVFICPHAAFYSTTKHSHSNSGRCWLSLDQSRQLCTRSCPSCSVDDCVWWASLLYCM